MTSTWNSASTSTSISSQKYNLDENGENDILVYQYQKGLAIESESSLCKTLDKSMSPSNPSHRGQDNVKDLSANNAGLATQPMRVSRKKIPRGNSRIEVRQEDLYNDSEKKKYAKYPNSSNSLANIGLPRLVYWKRLLLNEFQDLYIVSPESSPENSPASSQHVSPVASYPPHDSFSTPGESQN
jgi:hypothetical protein